MINNAIMNMQTQNEIMKNETQQEFSKALSKSRLDGKSLTASVQSIVKDHPKLSKDIQTHFSANDVVEIIQDIFGYGISSLEMAIILSDLGFDVFDIAEAIRDSYPNTSAKEMVNILKNPDVHPDTTRNEMIKALSDAGYNVYDTMNAVTPTYPEMVLIACPSEAPSTITADPKGTVDSFVFFYNPEKCPDKIMISNQPHKCLPAEVKSMLVPDHTKIMEFTKEIGIIRYQLWRNDMYYETELFPDPVNLLIQVKCLLSYSIGEEYREPPKWLVNSR